MLKNRSCSWCDSTGITEKGFCCMCKGKGYMEVIDQAVFAAKQQPNLSCLIRAISKHTTPEQFSNIMNDC
ncbi:hypothetical protein ORN01_13605 [Bacillus cereus]|uniref:Uncharacterized protein n=5 Tax=Bacillus cereus group TaxID=86661 RepID=A0A9X5BZR0_BACCE|nr:MULTISPECIES: hypothetical protein [Bacillus]MCU7390787.1 hypothetical protein [Bacillus sp. ST24]TKV47838.1 hypothetical protein C1I58_10840 [Bacillus sp. PIC28]HCF51762.1 hypothetical protein [Bacillus sp. (in: firmicutes)]AKR36536.1 Hypothetical protein NF53_3458 [Bacillus thuringiensis serovar indiana]ASJ49686.1 hypothetical protein BA204_17070 [Bacillus cereus]